MINLQFIHVNLNCSSSLFPIIILLNFVPYNTSFTVLRVEFGWWHTYTNYVVQKPPFWFIKRCLEHLVSSITYHYSIFLWFLVVLSFYESAIIFVFCNFIYPFIFLPIDTVCTSIDTVWTSIERWNNVTSLEILSTSNGRQFDVMCLLILDIVCILNHR